MSKKKGGKTKKREGERRREKGVRKIKSRKGQ